MADTVSTAAAVAVADPPEPGPEREYALVPLERIQVHPLNLRRELRGIDELADSIAQNGLLEPVLLVPAAEAAEDGGEQFVLIAGHRRHAASVAAKHSPVESIIRRDLDSEGAQVIAMLTENGPRRRPDGDRGGPRLPARARPQPPDPGEAGQAPRQAQGPRRQPPWSDQAPRSRP